MSAIALSQEPILILWARPRKPSNLSCVVGDVLIVNTGYNRRLYKAPCREVSSHLAVDVDA